MEQEIQKLQARLDKAKEVFREMNTKDKEKDARIAELEAQLAEAVVIANNNSTVGNDAITELKAQLKTMEDRYRVADKENENLQNNVEVANNHIAELKAQLRTMEDRYNHSDTYCEKFKEDNEKLSKENEMLRNQVEGAKNDINELTEANAKLKERNESYEIANEDLRFENMKNKGERDRIQIDYDKNVEVLKEVTDKNETMQSEIFELKDKLKEAESSFQFVNSEKDRLLSELEQANNYITKKETHFNNLQTLLNDRQAQIIELEKTIESLTSANKILEDELGQTRHDNSLIKENVTKHVAAIKSSMKGLNDGLGTDFDIFG